MTDTDKNKQILQNFIDIVWKNQNLNALKDFWTQDCINHAMPGADNRGIDALVLYHESFMADFSTLSNIQIEIIQQIAEGDRVVSYITLTAKHSGTFFGIPPTGKTVSMSAIRIDRFEDGKIAEHWSVADTAGLMQQLQT